MMRFSLLASPIHQICHKTPPNTSSWSVARGQPYATNAQPNFTTLDKSCTYFTRASTTYLSLTLKTVTSSSWKTAYKTFCLRSNPCQRFRLIKITGRFMKTHFDWWLRERFFSWEIASELMVLRGLPRWQLNLIFLFHFHSLHYSFRTTILLALISSTTFHNITNKNKQKTQSIN